MLFAPTLAAISGMLAAAQAAGAGNPMTALEISYITHAGEGAEGQKRVTRDGCYQTASEGSTGGSAYAFESQAGCHRTADVAAVFARLDAIPAAALAREAGAKGGGARRDSMPGGGETRVVLIRADGTRWTATNQATADDVLRAVNELPSENQWHATPPDKPVGLGPQLLTLMTTTVGKDESASRFEGSLASDGRWWCHRSRIGPRTGESRLPAKNGATITNAPARLGRILAGAQPDTRDEAQAASDTHGDSQISVEVAWPGKPRAALRPATLTATVSHRFVGEMRSLSPVCAIR